MDSLRNLPIYLRYEEDGTVVALCPLLPDCHCKAPSRAKALHTMQQLIEDAFRIAVPEEAKKAQRYEVVYLAVSPSLDSVNCFSDRLSAPKPESARIEIL